MVVHTTKGHSVKERDNSGIVDIEYTDVMGKAKIIFHYPRTLVLVLSCTIKVARGEGGVDSVDQGESRRDQHQQAAARLF